jgi:hypothetical protein
VLPARGRCACLTENRDETVSKRRLKAIKRPDHGRIEMIEGLVPLTLYKYSKKEPDQT